MKQIKKLLNIFLMCTLLFTEFSPFMVNAQEISKGDIRLGETVNSNEVIVTKGSLTNEGDIQITKRVSKTDIEGRYAVQFTVEGKDYHTTINIPIYTVFVLDASSSMNGKAWKNAKKAAINFSKAITSAYSENKIALVTFDANTIITKEFNNKAFIDSDFGNTDYGTNYNAGLSPTYEMLNNLKRDNPNAKMNVIFISDGSPNSSGCTAPSTNPNFCTRYNGSYAANLIKSLGADVYTFAYNLKDSNAQNTLKSLSTNNAFYSTDTENISSILDTIASKMLTQVAGSEASIKDNLGKDFTLTAGTGSSKTFIINDIKETVWTSEIFYIDIDKDSNTGWHPTNDGFTLTYKHNGETKTIICNDNPEVYWLQNTYDYRVEYYYDNVIDNDKTITGKLPKGDTLTISNENITKNIKEGFDYQKTDPMNNSIIISNNKENVIKVYYIKKTLNYKVEYYLQDSNGYNLNDSKELSIKYGEEANYTINEYIGYTYVSNKTIPINASDFIVKNNDLVIKLYYDKNNYGYKINYHYEGIDNPKVEGNTAKYKDAITVTDKMIDDHNIDGYKFSSISPPDGNIIVSDKQNNNVIDVYYIKDDFNYRVEYYYDNIIDNSKTDTYTKTYLDKVNTYEDKVINGYKLEKTSTLPLIITSKQNDNVIKVYYSKDKFNYIVNHYLENIDNNEYILEDTDEINGITYEDEATYELNNYYNYTYTKSEYIYNNIVSLNNTKVPSNNDLVINLYYLRNLGKVTAKYMIKDVNTGEYITFKSYGMDELGHNIEDFEGLELDDLYLKGKVGTKYKLQGRHPTNYKYIGLYLNDKLVSNTQEEYEGEYEEENIEFTYVYQPSIGNPPQTDVEREEPLYAKLALMGVTLGIAYCYISLTKKN